MVIIANACSFMFSMFLHLPSIKILFIKTIVMQLAQKDPMEYEMYK